MSKENDGEIKSLSLSELTREISLLSDAFHGCSDSIERSRREVGSYRRAQDVLLERTEAHTISINHLKESLGDAQWAQDKLTKELAAEKERTMELEGHMDYLEQSLGDAQKQTGENDNAGSKRVRLQQRVKYLEQCLADAQTFWCLRGELDWDRLQQRVTELMKRRDELAVEVYKRAQEAIVLREELVTEKKRIVILEGHEDYLEECLGDTQKQQRTASEPRDITVTPYKLISDRWFDGKAFTVDELLERCETTISYDTDGVFNLTVTGY